MRFHFCSQVLRHFSAGETFLVSLSLIIEDGKFEVSPSKLALAFRDGTSNVHELAQELSVCKNESAKSNHNLVSYIDSHSHSRSRVSVLVHQRCHIIQRIASFESIAKQSLPKR